MKLTAALCSVPLSVFLLWPLAAIAADGTAPGPELALFLYDFQGVAGTEVPDGSGHGHAGTLRAGEIIFGRNKPAVQFAGNGLLTTANVPADLDFSAQTLTVGAMCKPTAPDGVIVAMGDAEDGFTSTCMQACRTSRSGSRARCTKLWPPSPSCSTSGSTSPA